MSAPTFDTAVKVSSEAAEEHVRVYYQALPHNRNTIASFYVPQHTGADGKTEPTIQYNGTSFDDGNSFQSFVSEKLPALNFDVQTVDCQVINPIFTADGSLGPDVAKGKNMTILVLVGGTVRVGVQKDSETRGFSETFVLAPNLAAANEKRKGKAHKEWLIQSQNFRFVT